eukprot:jgi/Mesvir1/27855/Mv07524-RA.1
MNKLTRPQKEKLRQFCAVSDASEKVGMEALKAADWDLEAAFELHYNHGGAAAGPAGRQAGGGHFCSLFLSSSYPQTEENGPILVDGVTQLCEDLEVEPSDVVMLVLSWHMKAETMCEYSKEEFIGGLRKLNCDSIDKLRALLPTLRKEINDEAKFGAIYNFAFNWSKERGQKSLALDTALGMWQLVFSAHPWPLVDKWCLFVQLTPWAHISALVTLTAPTRVPPVPPRAVTTKGSPRRVYCNDTEADDGVDQGCANAISHFTYTIFGEYVPAPICYTGAGDPSTGDLSQGEPAFNITGLEGGLLVCPLARSGHPKGLDALLCAAHPKGSINIRYLSKYGLGFQGIKVTYAMSVGGRVGILRVGAGECPILSFGVWMRLLSAYAHLIVVESLCLDDVDGVGQDLGCPSDTPYCRDFDPDVVGRWEDAVEEGLVGNNGNGYFGMFCGECFDNSWNGTDTGCSSSTPHCLHDNHTDGYATNLVGYDCAECDPSIYEGSDSEAGFGCTDDKPLCSYTDEAAGPVEQLWKPRCFACRDTKPSNLNAEGEADYACDEGTPFCADLLQVPDRVLDLILVPIFRSRPIFRSPGNYVGSFCAECVDDLEQASIVGGFDPLTNTLYDLNCNSSHPFCIDGNATLGSQDYGFCSDSVNPVCDFEESSDGSLAHIPAVCKKALAADIYIVVTLKDCFVLNFDLAPVAAGLQRDFLPFIPACAMDTKLEKRAGQTRKLLQLPTESEFILQLKVYVDDIAQGQSVVDIINSPAFAQWLTDTFQISVAQAAQLVDLQAVFLFLASGTSDPHFTTLAGDKFDFNGIADQNYCIVSDKQVQVNAHFAGVAAGNALASPVADARTWMDQLAIMHGSDRILIEAASGADATYATAIGNVVVNGALTPHRVPGASETICFMYARPSF